MIRLIALDLDQTLFGSDLVASPRVSAAIARAQAADVIVTIATGREARLATRFANELNLKAPIICAQGGCIYDHVRNQVLREVRLSRDILPRILESAQRYGWNIHFELSDRLYFPRESRHPAALFELLRYSNCVRVGDLLKDMPEPPHKLIVTLVQTADRGRIMNEMLSAFGDALTVVASHPHLVEGLPAGVDKGTGLAWLAGHLRVSQPEVMAIGDSEADVAMLRWAGLGIAMGNAAAPAKAVAKWVAPPLEEDGAAVAIERYILSDEPMNASRASRSSR